MVLRSAEAIRGSLRSQGDDPAALQLHATCAARNAGSLRRLSLASCELPAKYGDAGSGSCGERCSMMSQIPFDAGCIATTSATAWTCWATTRMSSSFAARNTPGHVRSWSSGWIRLLSGKRSKGHNVHVCLSATKDVVDAIMADPVRSKMVSTIDLRWWWYEADGRLFAPEGGKEVAGRYAGEVSRTTPVQIHRQVKEYRQKHPTQALILGVPGSREHAWAALMGGASLLVGQLPYPNQADPKEYISPELCLAIQSTYDFIRNHLASDLTRMSPQDELVQADKEAWCLADANQTYLVYIIESASFRVDLSAATGSFQALWFDPRTGAVSRSTVAGGGRREFQPPGPGDWALLIKR